MKAATKKEGERRRLRRVNDEESKGFFCGREKGKVMKS